MKRLFPAAIAIFLIIGMFSVLWAFPEKEELGDVWPLGQPDSSIDFNDVQAVFGFILEGTIPDRDGIDRSDLAPATIFGDPGDYPLVLKPFENPAGDYSIGDAVLVARRAAGRIAFDGLNKPPTVTLDETVALTNDPMLVVSGTATDEDGELSLLTVQVFLNGAPYGESLNVDENGRFDVEIQLEEGENGIFSVATDDHDKESEPSETLVVELDTMAPELFFIEPEDGFLTNETLVFIQGYATDDHEVALIHLRDEETMVPVSNPDGTWGWGADFSLDLEGPNVFGITATDNAGSGNTTDPPAEITIIRDTTDPALSVDVLPTLINDPVLVVTGSCSDAYGVDSVEVNGLIEDAGGAENFDFSIPLNLSEGVNEIAVVCFDMAGNGTENGENTVTLDTIAPNAVLVDPEPPFISVTPYDVMVDFSEPGEITRLRGQDVSIIVTAGENTFSGQEFVNGSNDFSFTMNDDAGNPASFSFEIVLDTIPPTLNIVNIEVGTFNSDPGPFLDDELNGMATDAETINVIIEATDASGVDYVEVKGFGDDEWYAATLDEESGLYELRQYPIYPRENNVLARGFDLAGLESQDTKMVYRDIEGPEISLSLGRAEHVSTDRVLEQALNGMEPIQVTGFAQDLRLPVTDLVVSMGVDDGALVAVPLDSSDYFDEQNLMEFTFTIHPDDWAEGADLYDLEILATDTFDNVNRDLQSMLSGPFYARGEEIVDSVGLALDEEGLDMFESTIEEQLKALPGHEMDFSFSQSGADIDVYGISLCKPPNYYTAENPNLYNAETGWSAFNCGQGAEVTMSLTDEGHINLNVDFDAIYGDLRFSGLGCNTDAYIISEPLPITMRMDLDFVTVWSEEEQRYVIDLEPIGDTQIIGDFGFHHNGNFWCSIVITFADLIVGGFGDVIKDSLRDEIGSMLDPMVETLREPLLAYTDTNFEMRIASWSNDTTGMKLWLGTKGDPCPDSSSMTNFPNEDTPDPDDTKPCPDPSYGGPGSLATLNDDSNRVNLDLMTAADPPEPVSMEIAVNDDYLNYLLFSTWVQGGLDMTIDQETLGEGIELNTAFLGNTIPDLNMRPDVLAVIPSGTPLVIEMHPKLAPVILALPPVEPESNKVYYELNMGEMHMRFMGDVEGDGAFDDLVFEVAVNLRGPVDFTLEPSDSMDALATDRLKIEIGELRSDSDLIDNPLVLPEDTVRDAMDFLMGMVKDQLIPSLADPVDMPGSGFRIQAMAQEGTQKDFMVLSAFTAAGVAISEPSEAVSTPQDLDFVGEITGLKLGEDGTADFAFEWYIKYLPEGEYPDPQPGYVLQDAPEGFLVPGELASTYSWGGDGNPRIIPFDALTYEEGFGGMNEIRVAVYDNNRDGRASFATLKVEKAPEATEVVPLGETSCLGSTTGNGLDGAWPWFLSILLVVFVIRRIRLRTLSPMIALALIFVFAGCGGSSASAIPGADDDSDRIQSDGDTEEAEDSEIEEYANFTGTPVTPDPVVVLNFIQIGEENEGFNLDDGSPEADPEPDNAIFSLGNLANEPLQKGVENGDLILTMQFNWLKALPVDGEEGEVSIIGYLGIDQDSDPTDNFSGSEVFLIDPDSYDLQNRPQISFPKVTVKNEGGKVTFDGGPTDFTISVPISEGNYLELNLIMTRIAGTIVSSPLSDGGIEIVDAFLGGIIPCAAIVEPVEAIGMSPMVLLHDYVDIDLNEDGYLDKENHKENVDGISAALKVTGVPAFLSDEEVNRNPILAFTEIPTQTDEVGVHVVGTFLDPDGDCTKGSVSVSVNEGEPVQAHVSAGADACVFEADVSLTLIGVNTVVATGTDENGGQGSTTADIELTDNVAPVVTLNLPGINETGDPSHVVSGTATDNVGILGVEIKVNEATYAVTGDELGENGEFSVDTVLTVFGSNSISAQAKDLADNLSSEESYYMILLDEEGPTVAVTRVSDGVVEAVAPEPFVINRTTATLFGEIDDNQGLDGVVLFAETTDAGRDPVQGEIDSVTGTFSISLEIALGSNSITLRAIDIDNNETLLPVEITLEDGIAPEINVVAPGTTVDEASQRLAFTVADDFTSDPALFETSVSVNQGETVEAIWNEEEQWFETGILLQFGDNSLSIRVDDEAGNTGEFDGIIELTDETLPVLVIHEPPDQSETLEPFVIIRGNATDNIAPPVVEVTLGEYSWLPILDDSGEFEQQLDSLTMGQNEITVTARDQAGNLAEKLLTVERLDPDEPISIELWASETAVSIGGQSVVLTAKVSSRTGLVPDGTSVHFRTSDSRRDLLAENATTVSGLASVDYLPGMTPETVVITAFTDNGVSDETSFSIVQPTGVELALCATDTASFFGVDFQLVHSGTDEGAIMATPVAGSVSVSDSFLYHAANSPSNPTRLLFASADVTTPNMELFRLVWPVESGLPEIHEFQVVPGMMSDGLGEIRSGSDVYVCEMTPLLDALPPVVAIDTLPSEVEQPEITVTGMVTHGDLASVTARIRLNENEPEELALGPDGYFSYDLILVPGTNRIEVSATDSNELTGRDSTNVIYAVPNDPPEVAITYPGSTTSLAEVTVEGTVFDAQTLDGLTVSVTVGDSEPVDCTVDYENGTWVSNSPLPLEMGRNELRVKATDNMGAIGRFTLSLNRIAPVLPPVVTIEEPEESTQIFTNPVRISGTVQEGSQNQVVLTVNGEERDLNWNPYASTFRANVNLDDGPNTIRVTATDITLQEGFDEVNVTFMGEAPVVAIQSPQSGGSPIAANYIMMEGTIRDDNPLNTLHSFIVATVVDGVEMATTEVTIDNPEALSSAWSATVQVFEGENRLEAVATDLPGNNNEEAFAIVVVTPPPVVVMESLQIGEYNQGFNVDQVGTLGDISVDNALTGLGELANPLLDDATHGTGDSTLFLLFEFSGLATLPGDGEQVLIDIVGYLGEYIEGGDLGTNRTGEETFSIKPESFDETGEPLLRLQNVVVSNSFGEIKIDTYPDSPAAISIDIPSDEMNLTMIIDPTYLKLYLDDGFILPDGSHGIEVVQEPQRTSLIGGVVPAATLAMELDVNGTIINPLETLLNDSPPIPDVDLNEDGELDTTDGTETNRDGISVGITIHGTPCQIVFPEER